jgi:CRISPR-associated protein Cas2
VEMLIAYDVATDSREGRRRLRRVAKICVAFGQRVQKSVFECVLSEAELQKLKHRLIKEINADEDSLRFYRLREPRERYLQVVGQQPEFDIREPIVV